MADAILRDSLLDGQPFRVTPVGKSLDTASAANATDLYGFCPTALIFGLWDSTGPRGGSGTKFQRALVSEIVGVDVAQGVRPSSRLDPLGIELNAGKIFQSPDGWTLSESMANREKDRPVLFGKEGKPSEINHGNVTPSLKNEKGQFHHGGITMLHAQQSVVLSLPALRRLSFPDGAGEITTRRDLSARTALAALALAGAHLSIASGCDLRSRCLLLPDPEAPADWEVVGMNGRASRVHIADPCALVVQAAAAAQAHGLPAWRSMPIVLNPKADLVELVRRSRALRSAEPVQG
jgi:CRISPR-associated protein Csb1